MPDIRRLTILTFVALFVVMPGLAAAISFVPFVTRAQSDDALYQLTILGDNFGTSGSPTVKLEYILAVDRGNERVGTPYDSLHPAILEAVVDVVRKAHERGTPVSVCGELAGDPAGALVLIGAGVDSLSMSPASLSRVKLVIRSFTLKEARALLEAALEQRDGRAVHQLLKAALDRAGVLEGSLDPAEG